MYLPFEVPVGTTRIDIHYEFDAAGGSILDLGVFDTEIAPFPARTGFRGWSGSARRAVFIASDDATPGYLPGRIQPGHWQVILGLARVAPQGCAYLVEINLDDRPRRVTAPPVVPQPLARPQHKARWYRGDLQSHTFYSDARGSPQDLVQAARNRGLEFLAVTEHNTSSHHRILALLNSPRLLLIPGEEVTTYRGHANVWGVHGWTDFRVDLNGDLDLLIDDVHERGGLFSINHPKATPDCLGCDWEYPIPEGTDSFEAWQGPWAALNWESLARYDQLLRHGRRITLVGGSDRHQPAFPDPDPHFLQVGSPTTWLELPELTTPAVLDAIRAGRAFVSESPAGPQLELTVGNTGMGGVFTGADGIPAPATARVRGAAGDRLRWVGSAGVLREVLIDVEDFEDQWSWMPQGCFLRIEVIAAASLPRLEAELCRLRPEAAAVALAHPWRRALSNPVYLE